FSFQPIADRIATGTVFRFWARSFQALFIRSVDRTRRCAEHSVLVGEFSTPFDEFEHPSWSRPAVRRGILTLWVQTGLRGLSFSALWVAILTASFLIVRHILPLIMGSQPPITLKSAVPLIAIGISYSILIITLRRTVGQRLVGIFMGLAFVLWGLEQFLSDHAVISFIDDIVVFL